MSQLSMLPQAGPPLPSGFELSASYLGSSQAQALHDRLLADLDWERPAVSVWGRSHPMPRAVCWMGDPGCGYRYSGVYRSPAPWHPWLARLRQKLAEDTSLVFNSVLANLYENGDDKVGWHADDEPELGPAPIIASISLGATRDFRIRPKDRGEKAMNIQLTNGSLLLMRAGVQAGWEHCVPARAGVKAPRINLTFRHVLLPKGRG